MTNLHHGRPVFDATLALKRQPATPNNLLLALFKYPFMTAKVALGIYWQALLLWLKRIPVYTHPPAALNTKDSL